MDSQTQNQKQKQKQNQAHTHKASPAELLSSAKVVADAAKAGLRHESNKVDKSKVADAAADLLCGASHYGKLEGKSYGKYVEKAENYLHQYNTTHDSAAHNPSTDSTAPSAHPEGGFGDFMKMAQGFLKKH